MEQRVWATVDRYVKARKLDQAVRYLERRLRTAKSRRFDALLGTAFSNDAVSVAKSIEAFRAAQRFPVKAIYLEMNGFDINPDRWHFDYFGYDSYDKSDLDWLSDFAMSDFPSTTLTGLEKVQKVYAWYSNRGGYKDPDAKAAATFATLLVMCRFAQLIELAVNSGAVAFGIPILATAHDFDIVPRFLPKPPSPKRKPTKPPVRRKPARRVRS